MYDAPGTIGPKHIYGTNAAYNFEYHLPGWGDYTYMSTDRVNQKDRSAIAYYTVKIDTWGVVVARLQV